MGSHAVFLRIDELQGRLLWCQSRNPRITGAICKTSWESIDNHWIPATLSECNLFACSQLLGEGAAKKISSSYWCNGWRSVTAGVRQPMSRSSSSRCLSRRRRRSISQYMCETMFSIAIANCLKATAGRCGAFTDNWRAVTGYPVRRRISTSPATTRRSRWLISRKSRKKKMRSQPARSCWGKQRKRSLSRRIFPAALALRWREEWQGLALYCQTFTHAQKAFFTLHFAREVEKQLEHAGDLPY